MFRPGETEQTIAVTAADDGRDEQDEVFSVRLRRPAGATIGDAVAEAVIVDEGGSQAWIWLLVAIGVAAIAAAAVLAWRVFWHGPPVVPVPFVPRYLNLAITDEEQRLLPESRTLLPEHDYRVKIDIGKLDAVSLVANPTPKLSPGRPSRLSLEGIGSKLSSSVAM